MHMSGVQWIVNLIGRPTRTDSVIRRYRQRSSELRNAESLEQMKTICQSLLDDLAEQRLIAAALVQALIETGAINESRLRACAERLDAADGKVDGKLSGQLGLDGTVTINPDGHRSKLDDLADAVGDE